MGGLSQGGLQSPDGHFSLCAPPRPPALRRLGELAKRLRLQNVVGTLGLIQVCQASHPKPGSMFSKEMVAEAGVWEMGGWTSEGDRKSRKFAYQGDSCLAN